MVQHYQFDSIHLYITVDNDVITHIDFEPSTHYIEGNKNSIIFKQFKEYFNGNRKSFDIEIDYSKASPLQKEVWDALLSIEYGKTISYSDLAQMTTHPKAIRAVATCVGQNPIPVIIPCHRVILKSGKVGQFSGGVHIKEKLLEIENEFK